MDPGRLMGIGRMGLFGGVGAVTIGVLGGLSPVAWGGVALTGFALFLNSSGKIVRYGRIDIPLRYRLLVIGAWSVLVLALFALVVDYTYATFHAGYDGYFWVLAIGAVGFTMVYQGTRSKFVPDGDTDTDGETDADTDGDTDTVTVDDVSG